MLRVNVELAPNGRLELRRTIASMQIGNVSNLAGISDRINATESASPMTSRPAVPATCIVAGHDRRSAVWVLLAKAAAAMTKPNSVNVDLLNGTVFVTIDLVAAGIEHRRENIAALRISAIPESSGGGFLVAGLETQGTAGGYGRSSARIGPHGRNQPIWLLVANAAYTLNTAKIDEVQGIAIEDF
jgi:hypothetical protein